MLTDRIAFRADEDMAEALGVLARANSRTMGAEARVAVQEYIARSLNEMGAGDADDAADPERPLEGAHDGAG